MKVFPTVLLINTLRATLEHIEQVLTLTRTTPTRGV
jgi:hypothetical protein